MVMIFHGSHTTRVFIKQKFPNWPIVIPNQHLQHLINNKTTTKQTRSCFSPAVLYHPSPRLQYSPSYFIHILNSYFCHSNGFVVTYLTRHMQTKVSHTLIKISLFLFLSHSFYILFFPPRYSVFIISTAAIPPRCNILHKIYP